LDEIVTRARELLEDYRKKMVAHVEAEERYRAVLPVVQTLTPGIDLQPQQIDIEKCDRLWKMVEQTQQEKQEALRVFWEFREQHRQHLLQTGFLH